MSLKTFIRTGYLSVITALLLASFSGCKDLLNQNQDDTESAEQIGENNDNNQNNPGGDENNQNYPSNQNDGTGGDVVPNPDDFTSDWDVRPDVNPYGDNCPQAQGDLINTPVPQQTPDELRERLKFYCGLDSRRNDCLVKEQAFLTARGDEQRQLERDAQAMGCHGHYGQGTEPVDITYSALDFYHEEKCAIAHGNLTNHENPSDITWELRLDLEYFCGIDAWRNDCIIIEQEFITNTGQRQKDLMESKAEMGCDDVPRADFVEKLSDKCQLLYSLYLGPEATGWDIGNMVNNCADELIDATITPGLESSDSYCHASYRAVVNLALSTVNHCNYFWSFNGSDPTCQSELAGVELEEQKFMAECGSHVPQDFDFFYYQKNRESNNQDYQPMRANWVCDGAWRDMGNYDSYTKIPSELKGRINHYCRFDSFRDECLALFYGRATITIENEKEGLGDNMFDEMEVKGCWLD